MSRKKRLAINMVAQIISFIINVGINLKLTPYVTVHVGKEVYGFVNLAFQTTGYITIITTALNAMLGRYVMIKLSQKDYESASIYFTSVTLANAAIALILVMPSAILLLFLEKVIHIPPMLVLDVKWLWIFIVSSFIINLVWETYGISTYVSNRLDLSAKRSIESNIMKVVIMFSLYSFFSPKVWYIGIATLVCGIYIIITNKHYLKKFVPELKIKKKYFRWYAVKELLLIGAWNSINQLAQSLINGLDMIITNIYIGAAEMTLMGFAKAIPVYITALVVIISSSFAPQLTMVYAKGDMEAFAKEVNLSNKICGFICSVPILGYVAFGTSFFHIWLYSLTQNEVTVVQMLSVLTILQTVFDIHIFSVYTVNAITCKLKWGVLVNLLIGIVNVAGTIILLKTTNLGVFAVQIVSSSLLVMRVFLFAPLYASHILKVKWTTFYRPLFKGMLSSAVVLGFFYLVNKKIVIDSWLKLGAVAVVCGLAGYLINYIILLNKDERKRLRSFIFRKKVSIES